MTRITPAEQLNYLDLLAPPGQVPTGGQSRLQSEAYGYAATQTAGQNHPDTAPASCTEVAPADVKRVLERDFKRFDRDGNGYISETEINRCLQDTSLSCEDQQVAAMLKSLYTRLQDLDYDPLRFGRGISRDDITKFDQVQNKVHQKSILAAAVQTIGLDNLGQLDSNGNGYISVDELDRAIARNNTPAAQQAIKLLKDHYKELETSGALFGLFASKGISLQDLRKLVSDYDVCNNLSVTREQVHRYREQHHSAWDNINPFSGPTDQSLVISANQAMASVRREAGNNKLYENENNPLESIIPAAINQGHIGDCYFLAALSSMAASDNGRQTILNMIRDNHNGTFTVTFPGAANEPITIKAPTPAEMAIYNEPFGHGNWSAVMEKAYGEYCNRHFWRRNIIHNPLPRDEQEEGSDGGSVSHAGLRILTGKGVDEDTNVTTSLNTMNEKLTRAFREGRPVTAYASQMPWDAFFKNDVPRGHEYGVLAWDPVKKLITIRNPWGFQEPEDKNGNPLDGKDDGVFTMSLEEFKRRFTGLAYSE